MVEGSKQPSVPPALRKVNWRELLQILQASQQVGLPCSVNTDASLGRPLHCYQSYEILLGNYLGAQSILLQVAGARSRGSEAAKQGGVAKRAKCGFCPCCSRATHALIPATYESGQFGRRKANAVLLWQLYGLSRLRGRNLLERVQIYPRRMALDCDQTRGFVTPGFGFGVLAPCGYAGAVGFSIGLGRCPPRQIVADVPLPRVLGLELCIQGTAKAPSTQSARESSGPSKVAPPRTPLPFVQKIFVGWGLGAFE